MTQVLQKACWVNGVAQNHVQTPISPALVHGVGAFETVRVENSRALLKDAHVLRLEQSLLALGYPIDVAQVTCQALATDVRQALASIAKASDRCGAMRWIVLPKDTDSQSSSLERVISFSPWQHPPKSEVRLITLPNALAPRWPTITPKSTSYGFYRLLHQRALAQDADDALLVNDAGHVLEATTGNVFARLGQTLITPAAELGLLRGTVRAWVIDNASEIGLAAREGLLTTRDLENADEVWVTSSLRGIAKVSTLDARAFNHQHVMQSTLQERYLGAFLTS